MKLRPLYSICMAIAIPEYVPTKVCKGYEFQITDILQIHFYLHHQCHQLRSILLLGMEVLHKILILSHNDQKRSNIAPQDNLCLYGNRYTGQM